MRLLAIDTALAACSAAVYDPDLGVIASESLPMTRGHAEALLPLIGRVIAAAAMDFSALGRIAVTVGPGSFTGIRVGVAAARGIALAAGTRAVGVTTLHVLAAPYLDGDTDVVAAVDARHDHVYFQQFDARGDAVARPQVVAVNDAAMTAAKSRARVVGNATALIDAVWPADFPPAALIACDAPDIAWVAKLGARQELAHEMPKPLYLRAPDAKPQDMTTLLRPA